MDRVFQFFFLSGLIVIFVISVFILRPFRKHRRRKISTISLKLSYLSFLLIFFIFIYLLLFKNNVSSNDGLLYDTIFNIHFLTFASATIVPNIGIMMRQRIKNKRSEYNIAFSMVNLFYATYLTALLVSGKWAML